MGRERAQERKRASRKTLTSGKPCRIATGPASPQWVKRQAAAKSTINRRPTGRAASSQAAPDRAKTGRPSLKTQMSLAELSEAEGSFSRDRRGSDRDLPRPPSRRRRAFAGSSRHTQVGNRGQGLTLRGLTGTCQGGAIPPVALEPTSSNLPDIGQTRQASFGESYRHPHAASRQCGGRGRPKTWPSATSQC